MLDTLPISSINKYITGVLPIGWQDFELETIFMELGVKYSELLADKINVIRGFHADPELFYTDPVFFMYATEVINNNVVDFDSIPSINSLEAAYSIVEAAKLSGAAVVEDAPKYERGVRELVKHILKQDGYSEVVWPFDTVGVTGLVAGAAPEDTAMKRKAIKEYIDGLSSKPAN